MQWLYLTRGEDKCWDRLANKRTGVNVHPTPVRIPLGRTPQASRNKHNFTSFSRIEDTVYKFGPLKLDTIYSLIEDKKSEYTNSRQRLYIHVEWNIFLISRVCIFAWQAPLRNGHDLVIQNFRTLIRHNPYRYLSYLIPQRPPIRQFSIWIWPENKYKNST